MNPLLILPILIPLVTAIFALLFREARNVQRALSLLGALGLFGASAGLMFDVRRNGIQAAQVGNWPAPYGITLVADLFGAIMVLLAGIIAVAVVTYSLFSVDAKREEFGYHSLIHFLLMGVCGSFLTGDLFNLYVWFEVMLMGSFVLMALGGERGQMEGAIKYVTLNLLSSAMFLSALGLLYAMAGTLNMADLADKFSDVSASQPYGVVTTLAMLFMVAFGIKAAVFPLFFWLPASYHTPPAAISALFAGLLTKVGVYALIRIFTLIFVQDAGFTHTLILIIAGLTMVSGVLGAVAQQEFRRVLSFHIVSQIGYMIMGLGLFTPLALAGSVFYIAHHIIVKTNLFLISGAVEKLGKTPELKKLGGLYQAQPMLAILFLVPAMSLAGLPPLSGFFAKLSLARAGLETGQYIIVSIMLGVSLLTLFSMLKLWNEAFWKPLPVSATGSGGAVGMGSLHTWLISVALLAAITVLIGIGAGSFFSIALLAGEQLMNPQNYIQAVLGGA
ncbi:MAG: Na+/H+ antiporter subunit D [Chloroflexi bacterium]|nr:MAG: Na+/H+ antiporter subunit D [Chloroflexota bacterium]